MAEKKSDAPKAQPKPPSHIPVFYDARDGSYLLQVSGRFLVLGKSELKMHLIAAGLNEKVWHDADDGRLDEFNWILWNAHKTRMIDYSGPLAGHKGGIFTDGSQRKYLVTDQAHGVWDELDKDAEPAFFIEFVHELLPEKQAQFFCYWLALALRSLRKGDFRPGQVVTLAGPAGCGKSLLQSAITEIFGGRAASPFRYMMEFTQFNKDLAGAEHWQIEDPATTTDIRTRRQFGAKLKEATVNRDFSIHAKGKDALTLPLFRRVTISVNDEPENLAVVPPLDPSIEDKIFLFHCSPASKCFEPFRDAGGEVDRAKVWAKVMEEIPAIRSWLLNHFKKVPKDWRDDRFGIKAWHHPELRAELVALAPETRLLQLIDEAIFEDKDQVGDWTGKSSDLEKKLRNSEVAFEAEKILRFVGAAGSYLGRLAKSHRDRVSKRVSGGYTAWTITPPMNTQE